MNPRFTSLTRAWAAGQPSEQPTLELQPIPAALFRLVELLVAPPTRHGRGETVNLPGLPGRVHLVATPADEAPELEL